MRDSRSARRYPNCRRSSPLPEYVAEIVWLPAANPFVVRAAVPPESGAVPSNVLPSKNSTEPLGDPAPGATGATVAVSVAAWLKPEGFGVAATSVVVAARAMVSEPLTKAIV